MKTRFFAALPFLFLSACTVKPVTTVTPPNRLETYWEFYEENPCTILVLPTVNLTQNPEATNQFYVALFAPLANAGYYVIPPLATLQILQQENLDTIDLSEKATQLGELFGADLIVYTYIQQWGKSYNIDSGELLVEAEYFIVSAKTGTTLFYRRTVGSCFVQTEIEDSWLLGALTSTIRTAALSLDKIAASCSSSTFFDLPLGPYSPQYRNDQHLDAGPEYMVLRWGGD